MKLRTKLKVRKLTKDDGLFCGDLVKLRHIQTKNFLQNSRFDSLISGNKSIDTREGQVSYSFEETSDTYAKDLKEYQNFKELENWEFVCDNQSKKSPITK